ncbi:MAG: ABC transporter ATP-binding protein [Desulfurivibrionaceae bacterium]
MTESKGFDLSGVSFAYDGYTALRDLDITLPPGRFYGLVGPNGCGKTTLLDLLTGNKRPQEGRINFRDRDLGQYRRREFAREVSLVPQDFAIGFAFTVEEVVLMGRHPYIRRFGSPGAEDYHMVDRAMEQIGIDHLRGRYVNELSGGEKQRVVVARALAQNTSFLLLDEATSNLDIQYTLQIFNVVRKQVREHKCTVVAVMHNLNLAGAYSDEIVFMKNGRVAGSGPTLQVLEPGMIREVFGVESRVSLDSFSQAPQVSFRYHH